MRNLCTPTPGRMRRGRGGCVTASSVGTEQQPSSRACRKIEHGRARATKNNFYQMAGKTKRHTRTLRCRRVQGHDRARVQPSQRRGHVCWCGAGRGRGREGDLSPRRRAPVRSYALCCGPNQTRCDQANSGRNRRFRCVGASLGHSRCDLPRTTRQGVNAARRGRHLARPLA